MANTAYTRALNKTLVGWAFYFDVRTTYGTIKRSNNTITIPSFGTTMRINADSPGYNINGFPISVITQAPSGTTKRTSSLGSGSFTRGGVYNGSTGSYNINVSASATSITTRSGVIVDGTTGYGSSQTITIPALGTPSVTEIIQAVSDTTITARPDVTSWGANATSGSVITYIATQSNFSDQTGISTSDNVAKVHQGLTPNSTYYLRGYAKNAGTKDAYSSSVTQVTLASATETSKDVGSSTIEFHATVTTGVYSTSTIVQYRQLGDTVWLDSDPSTSSTPDITISSLTPNKTYEYRYAVTTTAGTWTSAIFTSKSVPAVALKMPDGTLVQATPHVILPDGTSYLVNITKIGG